MIVIFEYNVNSLFSHLIDLEFTGKDFSPWGGLRVAQELMERIDFRCTLNESGLPGK